MNCSPHDCENIQDAAKAVPGLQLEATSELPSRFKASD